MSSVDGRLLPTLWTPPFDGTETSLLFREYTKAGVFLGTDAWMFGKTTLTEIFPMKYSSCDTRRAENGSVYVAPRTSERLFVAIDPEADILFTSNSLRGDDMVIVLDRTAAQDYLEYLRDKGISYIVMDMATDLPAVMCALGEHFGIKSISLQGGGIINGEMLAAGLLDELSLVVYPGIDGNSQSPSAFEYVGDGRAADGQALEFISAEVLSYGIVWMRYNFVKQLHK